MAIVDISSPSIVPAPTDDRRAALFRETPLDRLERWVLGIAWALKPGRIGGLPALGRLWLADRIAPDERLPDPEQTLNRGLSVAGQPVDPHPNLSMHEARALSEKYSTAFCVAGAMRRLLD